MSWVEAGGAAARHHKKAIGYALKGKGDLKEVQKQRDFEYTRWP